MFDVDNSIDTYFICANVAHIVLGDHFFMQNVIITGLQKKEGDIVTL